MNTKKYMGILFVLLNGYLVGSQASQESQGSHKKYTAEQLKRMSYDTLYQKGCWKLINQKIAAGHDLNEIDTEDVPSDSEFTDGVSITIQANILYQPLKQDKLDDVQKLLGMGVDGHAPCALRTEERDGTGAVLKNLLYPANVLRPCQKEACTGDACDRCALVFRLACAVSTISSELHLPKKGWLTHVWSLNRYNAVIRKKMERHIPVSDVVSLVMGYCIGEQAQLAMEKART